MEVIFGVAQNVSRLAQNVKFFLVWPKKFVPAKNSLGPVEWRGIKILGQNLSL